MMMTSTSTFRKAALVGTLSALIALGACSKPADKAEAPAGATATQAATQNRSDELNAGFDKLQDLKAIRQILAPHGLRLN